MGPFAFPAKVEDKAVRKRAMALLRDMGVRLPTFAELAEPQRLSADIRAKLGTVGPDDPQPHNLYRVHWFNDHARTGMAAVPVHVELPKALTGVPARIVVAIGALFPMIRAHKVLAAYACLVPRVVTGRFDPARGSALTWVQTIAVRSLIDLARRYRPARPLYGPDCKPAIEPVAAGTPADPDEAEAVVAMALATMNPRHRDAVRLRLAGVDQKTVGARLGLRPGNVAVIFHHFRAKVRELVTE